MQKNTYIFQKFQRALNQKKEEAKVIKVGIKVRTLTYKVAPFQISNSLILKECLKFQ